MGELLALGPVLRGLRAAGAEIVLTTTTSTGRRLAEAARLGFAKAIVPMSAPEKVPGISVHRVGSLSEALTVAQLPTA